LLSHTIKDSNIEHINVFIFCDTVLQAGMKFRGKF